MKRFLVAITLACVLSASALAGEIHSVGVPAPGEIPCDAKSTGNVPTVGSTSPGQIPTVGSTSPGDIPTAGLSVWLIILKLAF
jgi:hypothetical protein